jgi:chromosome segregation ATPase
MRGSKGFEIRRRAALCVYICAMAAVLFVVCGCGEQLTRMEENQVKLQAMVAANAREIATLSSQVHAGTAKLGDGIQNLDTQTQGIAAGVQTVQGEQKQLHETVVAGHQNLDAKATALREGQQSLQAQVAQVQDVTGRTASDLTTLAQRHTGLHETVQANQRELNTHMGVVASNQQGIQAGITRLHEADERLAQGITSVAGKQDAMQQSLNGNHEQVAGRLAGLAESQQKLQANVETLNAKADKAVVDSEAAVSSLQETLRVSREVVTGQMAAGLQNQQATQAAIQELHGKTDGLTANLAAVSAEQATAREASRANHDQIITAMAGLSDGHQSLRSGIDQVSGKADRINNGLTSMASDQKALQETTRTNHEAVAGRLGDLSKGQTDLHAGVNALNGKADAATSELSAAAQRQNTLQQTVAAGNEAMAAHATIVAANHQNVKAAVADLAARTQQVSTDLTTMASAQDGFRQKQQSHNESMTTRMTGLAEGQQALRGQVDLLTATTSQTALSMLTLNNGQATFQQAMQTGMNGLQERSDQTAAGVKGMIELNSAMNQTLAAQAAAMTENQQTLKTDVTRMAGVVDRAYADLTAVSLAQDTLQSTLVSRSEELSGRVARLDNNQKELAESLNILTATAGQTALDVMGLATGHADLHRSIKAGNDTVVARTTALADNQKTLGGQLDVLTATTSQTATDVIGMSDRQVALANAVRDHSDSAKGQMARLAESQQQMQSGLDGLTVTAGQTAANVVATAERQTEFAKAVQSHNESADGQMAKLTENQQRMQSGLDVLAITAGQTATEVTAITSRQDAIAKAIQSHDEAVSGRIAKLDDSQQKMQSGLDGLAVAAGQTAANVIATAERQTEFAKAVYSHNESANGQMATLAENQQRMQSGLDVLATTAGQTATEVTAITGRQDALAKAIHSHDEAVRGRIAKLDDNQQKIQSGLDGVTTTAGQTVRDIAALSETQTRSEQTAQAGRTEVVAKLVEIAQHQQGWLERFDAAQARIQAMADSITTLDQQVAKLQGVLQTGVQSTTTALDANGQQRQQFEAKIAQDVQAMIDALSQLRQTQAQLQEQVSQVHQSTQSQADTLKTTIEQLKAVPAQQPPVEVKVSDSAKPVEPVVVQTGE